MSHWDLPLTEVIRYWDSIDEGGSNLAGIRALCLTDRYYLLVRICRRVDALHPWVYARCREVERAPTGHLDLWAREHFKSTIITFAGIIQRILQDPEVTICIFSHVGAIASAFLRQVKTELEGNEILKAAFPDIIWQDDKERARSPVAVPWSVDGGITVKRKNNPKECTLESSGLVDGQPISKHFKLRVYDDVVTNASVSTPEQSQKTTDAYSLSQSLGMEGGEEWCVGTRYSYADTYDWLINRGALIPRVYAATDNGLRNGNLVLFSQEHWAAVCLKSTDNDIACQYMQNPLSGQSRMFDITDLQTYEIRPEAMAVYILIDPARSKKKNSADTAMMVVGLDYAMNKYLLDGMCHKMDLQERWDNMARLYMRWRVQTGVQVVKVGYEVYGAQADADYFKEQMKMPNRPLFEIVELAWPREGESSKEDRVQRLVPDVKGHKFYLPYETDDDNLTRNQRKMLESGYGYRISRAIRWKDENGQMYDLSEKLKMQFHYFPFGGKKDAIDATARVYDMEPKGPIYNQAGYLEPEFT